MQSNKTYHCIFKYSFLGIAVLLFTVTVISWVKPEWITVNGHPGTQELFGSLAMIAFLVFILIKDKFVIVELENQTIKVIQNGETRIFPWTNVQKITLIQLVYPPLYILRTKDSEESVWFNTQPEYVGINGFIVDRSDMGALIKKKKSEFGI